MIIGIIAGLCIFFIFKTFDDYREKNLADLIVYEQENLFGLGFAEGSNKIRRLGWGSTWVEDKETVEEFLEFLSQYQVKKINENPYPDYDGEDLNNEEDVEEEKLFEFDLHHKSEAKNKLGKFTKVLLGDDRINIKFKGYYEVLNGPIDSDWLSDFFKKIKDQNEEQNT